MARQIEIIRETKYKVTLGNDSKGWVRYSSETKHYELDYGPYRMALNHTEFLAMKEAMIELEKVIKEDQKYD